MCCESKERTVFKMVQGFLDRAKELVVLLLSRRRGEGVLLSGMITIDPVPNYV